MSPPDGVATVFCEGALSTPYGKTAHGLIRRTSRYKVASVIDSERTGWDAGRVLDGVERGIPVFGSVAEAVERGAQEGERLTHFVIGLAPDGGLLALEHRKWIVDALRCGLHIDSGLHEFLSEDPEFSRLANENEVRIRDVRKPPPKSELHFYSGKIESVRAYRIAILGTDSAVGKRTTAWALVDGFQAVGRSIEMVGTGQTAWMQGARHCIVLDSLVNDFVSGEIEHAVWSAWIESRPDVILIEGQGSLMNPAYPGGFEILAAARPHAVVLQHAPARKDYDGFPGYPVHPLVTQIRAIELVSGRPVRAVTVNHEGLDPESTLRACREIEKTTGLPTADVLTEGPSRIVSALLASRAQGTNHG